MSSESKPARQIVVVDCETNGLDLTRHQPVEVAWWNLNTGENGEFVPAFNPNTVMAEADLQALRVNGFLDRITLRSFSESPTAAGEKLAAQLRGNTLAGSNPSFDAAMLVKLPQVGPLWHHRMLDLSAYAAGVLGLDPTVLPGLASVAEFLGVPQYAPHTAWGDVQTTGECFLELFKRAGVKLARRAEVSK
jgi:DNA polymerase-3 subunit epsilon